MLERWSDLQGTAPAVQDKQLRLANLDLLRLVAALMIVAFHFGYRGPAAPGWTPVAFPEIAPVAQELWAGVSFFFMISGFVIAWSAQKQDAFGFALSRAARLYPAFLVCMTLTAVGLAALAPVGVEEFRMTMARFLANLPLFSKALGQPFVDGAYWSIVIEVIFYGWVTLFLALGIFHKRQIAILGVWLALAFLNEIVLRQQGLQYLLVTRHAGYFVLGILAYRAFAAARWPDAAEVALGLAAFALCLMDDQHYVTWMQATLGYAPSWSPVFAAAKLAVMLVVLNVAIRLPALLRPGWCVILGGITYPLYLLHQNLGYVLMYWFEPALGRWGALAAVIALTIAMAWAVFHFVEPVGRKLMLGWGNALRARAGVGRPSARAMSK
jgi:peptidoglycan/LPS O-acetylase OafA/YrhL